MKEIMIEELEEAKERLEIEKRTQSFLKGQPKLEKALEVALLTVERQIPKQPVSIQGNPVFGYCPNCGEAVLKSGNLVGCKHCLQRLNW